MSKNKTTKDHFRIFKEEANHWICYFGLIGWQVCFRHAPLDNMRAGCAANLSGRISTITLATEWGEEEIAEEQIRKSAFHEVCELLLSRFEILANSRATSQQEIEEERHNLIRIFENTIYTAIGGQQT